MTKENSQPVGLLTPEQWQEAYGRQCRPNAFTDIGNSTIFVRKYKEELIFTDSMGWLHWNGKNWERNEHKALELAEDFSNQMLKEARDLDREARHKKADLEADAASGQKNEDALKAAEKAASDANTYLKHALSTQRSGRVKAILDLARPFLVLPGNAMDANPRELNTQNGIVNLVTGEWRPNHPGAKCTKITAVSRSSDGEKIWQDFLSTITCGDGAVAGFLQMVIGMALFGEVYHEGVTFAIGDGSNGKSTFFNAVSAVLGDYAGYIDIDVILVRSGNVQAELATLRGKRLVIAGELGQGRQLSESTLKKITSIDPFQVQEKYKAPETIKPSHTLCLFANHLPHVKTTDDGTWRRIIVIPFNAKIEKKSDIKNYSKYLFENAGGAILAWAIEGAQNYARNGFHLDIPDAVAEATENYRNSENLLEQFIEECCVREPNARVRARELYTQYKTWCEAGGMRCQSEKDFPKDMKRAGFNDVSPKNKKYYIGLRIVQPYEQERVPDDYLPL